MTHNLNRIDGWWSNNTQIQYSNSMQFPCNFNGYGVYAVARCIAIVSWPSIEFGGHGRRFNCGEAQRVVLMRCNFDAIHAECICILCTVPGARAGRICGGVSAYTGRWRQYMLVMDNLLDAISWLQSNYVVLQSEPGTNAIWLVCSFSTIKICESCTNKTQISPKHNKGCSMLGHE